MNTDTPSPLDEKTERRLVKQAAKGDEAAFGQLYEFYFESLYRFFVYRTNSQMEAEDLCAQSFLKVWETITGGSPPKIRNFRAWLFRIAHNLLIDFYRKRKPVSMEETTQLSAETQPELEGRVLQNEQQKVLANGLQQLEEVYRDVLVCRMVTGLSHAETAEVLGLNEGHVRVLQHRALKQLRALVGSEIAG